MQNGEVKTYLTPGQSQALYAQFIVQVNEAQERNKLLHNLTFVIMPAIVLILVNVIAEGMAFRLISSLLLLSSTMITQSKASADPRGAIIDAIEELELYEEYELYARAIADPSEMGQQIAAILMETVEDIFDDKPSARIRLQISCKSTSCNHVFGVIVNCPAWGNDSCFADCPVCGCSTNFMIDGSMVDDRPEIDRLEAVGVPAAPASLIVDTSTTRLDESESRVHVLR